MEERRFEGGWRVRKRELTERRIQSAAIALFERNGYDAVTVEQVSAAADISVATVYRYFATKENLVLHDPVEQQLTDAIIAAVEAGDDIPAALERVLEQLPGAPEDDTAADVRSRIRLANEVAAIAGAAHIRARQRATQLIEALPEPSSLRARVDALAALAALEAAADHWHDHPEAGSLRDLSLEAIRLLRRRR